MKVKPVKIGRMTIYNKTGHVVNYKDENHEIIFHEEDCWRVNVTSIENSTTDLKTFNTETKVDFNLPKVQYGIYYIVSKKFKQLHMDRKDFIVPSQIVRNENNVVLYCKAFDS